MKTRKIILLTSIAVLSAVYIFQLIFTSGSKINYVTLKTPVESILIEQPETQDIVVRKNSSDSYLINEEIPADVTSAQTLFTEIASIKVVDTVAYSVSDENELSRYGLHSSSALTVKAFVGGNVVRTLKIGKTTTTGSQVYVQIDGSADVVLATGALRSYFEKTIDDLKMVEEETESDDSQDVVEGPEVLEVQ